MVRCSMRRRARTLRRSPRHDVHLHPARSLHRRPFMTPTRTPQPQQSVDPVTLRIAITGSTGLVGSALVPYLERRGHKVIRMIRKPPAPGSSDIHWDPARGVLDADDLEGVDAIIHLAGEPVSE